MNKKFRIRDRVLLGAAFLGDSFFEFVQPYSIQMAKLKGILPPDYKLTNFSSAVSKMLATGYMEKIIKKGEPYLRITGLGKRALVRDFPILQMKKQKWDKKWRIVYYDVAEKERGVRIALQRKLKELGFGMIQESVYISPFDVIANIREFVINQGLKEFVFVGEVNHLLAGNEKRLAEKVWDLERLSEQYEELEMKIHAKDQNISAIISQYEEIMKTDPCLPEELLPTNWIGDKVYGEIKRLVNKTKNR